MHAPETVAHAPAAAAGALLELVEITKAFPGVVALDRVSLSVGRGEVLGLIGENGAGKSTLMKILGGVTPPTSGVIRIDGRERRALSVADAIEAGIAFVHQELNLFDNLDVAANVFIGREPLYGGPLKLIDRERLHRQVQPLLDRLGVDFKPDTPVALLSLAQRQLLEIAQGAVARCARGDHGRADLEPDADRDRAPDAGDRAICAPTGSA